MIEIHNKPLLSYRYEICVSILINAWELILKAYIYKYLPKVKLFKNDGFTKEFSTCVDCVKSSLGRDFYAVAENLEQLYAYRNKVIHFYCEDLSLVIFGLMRANILFYAKFMKDHFKIDLSEENSLYLLPIGFKKPVSPIDFLSNESILKNSSQAVKDFIHTIMDRAKYLQSQGVQDSIFVEYKMGLQNVNRIKNADVIAAIDNSEEGISTIKIENSLGGNITPSDDGKKVKIEEDSVYNNIYKHDYNNLVKILRNRVNFKANSNFRSMMKEIKQEDKYYKERYLDIQRKKGTKKGYYSDLAIDELARKLKI